MGAHILRATRGVSDVIANPITVTNPCGFCGGVATGECEPKLKELSRSITCTVNCPRKEPFQYGSAAKGSNNRPCRNIPIMCRLCIHDGKETETRPAIWRYNMEAHLNEKHPEYAHPGKNDGLPLPRTVYEAMELTAAEEKKAGVPVRTVFTTILEKENAAPSNPRTQKRKANADRFVSAAVLAKRMRQ